MAPKMGQLKWAVTADWHLTMRPQDSYRWEFLKWLVGYIVKERIGRLFILGDITDDKDRHPSELVNRLVTALTEGIVPHGCRIYIVRGNHDATDPSVPFFGFLNVASEISFINRPTRLCLNGVNVMMIPHGTLASCSISPRADLILMHDIVRGARVANRVLDVGLNAADLVSSRRKRCILSGDIHWPQKVHGVEYVGAPYPIDFGDDYDGRVLVGFGNKWKSVATPRFRKWMADLRSGQTLGQALPDAKSGDMVRIRVWLKRRDYDSWAAIRQSVLEEAGKMSLVVGSLELFSLGQAVSLSSKSDGASTKRMAVDPTEQLRRYVHEQKIPKDVAAVGCRLVRLVGGVAGR